ncbi:MAG: hypothetical protein J6B04_01485 [Clostridia bacterium]|nr:hypothetical protein [Clostridia bacterium]
MKKSLRLLSCLLAAGFSLSLLSACSTPDDEPDINDNKDWGEIWENWGKDDWLDGDYEEYDPSQNYNKIDWTQKYPGVNSQKATDVTAAMTIYESQHVQILQAEKAALNGRVEVENGHHVGYFQDGSSVTWTVQSEKERNMLLVVNTSSPESENRYGLSMLDTYVVMVNEQAVDLSDGWIKSTSDWDTFVENVVGECSLKQGENVIKITSNGGTNLDYLKLVPEGELSEEELIVQVPGIKYSSMGLKLEAEELDYAGASVYNQGSGGILGSTSSATFVSAYVEANEETKVQFVLNGLFRVDDGSFPANAAQRFTLKLNGNEVDLSGASLNGIGDQDTWYKEPYSNNKLAEITLNKGTNLIEFSLKTGEINLDYFKLLPLGMDLDADIITSYDNVYTDGVKVQLEDTKFTGATVQKAGSGRILGITSGSTNVEFVLEAEEETTVEVVLYGLIRVDADYSEIAGRRFGLTVNDVAVDLSAGILTGSDNLEQWWLGNYANSTLGVIKLLEGKNVIKLSLKTGEINLDYLTFKSSDSVIVEPYTFDYESGMKVELEDTNFSGATIQTAASGSILGITSAATTLQFTLIATEETTVEVLLNALLKVDADYSAVASDRFTLTVNGNEVDLSASTLTGSENEEKWWEGSYASNSLGTITLSEGKNTITLSLKTNEINLDYVTLTTSGTAAQ